MIGPHCWSRNALYCVSMETLTKLSHMAHTCVMLALVWALKVMNMEVMLEGSPSCSCFLMYTVLPVPGLWQVTRCQDIRAVSMHTHTHTYMWRGSIQAMACLVMMFGGFATLVRVIMRNGWGLR